MKPPAQRYPVMPFSIRQNDLAYAGLIAVGLVVMEDFWVQEPRSTAALVAVLAFAVSLPLLTALIVLNRVQALYDSVSLPTYWVAANFAAVGGAFVGVAAAFWHVSALAGGLFVGCSLLGLLLFGAYTGRLDAENPDQAVSSTREGDGSAEEPDERRKA